jgi:predicted nucleic acid-binding protein
MLIDTDILIWYMRGNKKAKRVMENLKEFSISVVTYIELLQGLRKKEELNVLRNSLKQWNAEIIYINEEISIKAMFLVEQYCLSHSLQLADALLGSTALIHGLPLLTANTKHYKIIKNIILKQFHPE